MMYGGADWDYQNDPALQDDDENGVDENLEDDVRCYICGEPGEETLTGDYCYTHGREAGRFA